MNEQMHDFATNYVVAIPIAMVLTGLWLMFQKSKIKNSAKNQIMNNSFVMRNVFFVGILVFLIMYLGRPLPGLEESIIVRPADF